MKPHSAENKDQSELFRSRLYSQINRHDGWLGRNHLKGTAGDRVNVLLCCAGHKLRLILKRLRDRCARVFCRSVLGRYFRRKWVLLGANESSMALSAASARFSFR